MPKLIITMLAFGIAPGLALTTTAETFAACATGAATMYVGTRGPADETPPPDEWDGSVFTYRFCDHQWEDMRPVGYWPIAAVMDMAIYNGKLHIAVQTQHGYAGGGSRSQARVYRCDGKNLQGEWQWTLLGEVDHFGNPDPSIGASAMVLEVMGGILYVATTLDTGAGKLYMWSSSPAPRGTWQYLGGNSDGFRTGIAFDGCTTPYLFLGGLAHDYFYRYRANQILHEYHGGSCVWDFAEFNSRLYAGTFAGTGPVFESPPAFQGDGALCDAPCPTGQVCWFSEAHTTGANNWAVEPFEGNLYFGGGYPEPGCTGARLWRYQLGQAWPDPDTGAMRTWATRVENEGVSALAAVGSKFLVIGLGLPDGYHENQDHGTDGRAEIWLYEGSYYRRISDDDVEGGGTFDAGGIQSILIVGTSTDCNQNGVADETELLPDCNENGVPDICEPSEDRNGNALPDICDIHSGLLHDVNQNGVPDEYEDCNGDGHLDPDLDGDGVPDDCQATARIYVDGDVSVSGDGWSWNTAKKTLQEALTLAESRQAARVCLQVDVWVKAAAVPYVPSQAREVADVRTKTFLLPANVHIYGGFAGGESSVADRAGLYAETVLSADLANDDSDGAHRDENAYQVVSAGNASSNVVLDGFTITGGNADGQYYAHQYGAALCASGSELSVTLRNLLIRDNTAIGNGGAVYVSDGHVDFVNCAFAENTSQGFGGALYYFNPACTAGLTNCTVANNAAYSSAGVYVYGYQEAKLIVRNSVLWGNGDGSRDDQIDGYYDFIEVYDSCVEAWDDGFEGSDVIDDNPLLGDAAHADLRLSPASPCVDTGNNGVDVAPCIDGDQSLPDRDLAGHARIHDAAQQGIVDMGAYEHPTCARPPTDADGDGDVDLADFASFLTCFNGPQRPWSPGGNQATCGCMDSDADSDVDLADFTVFLSCFNGPNRPPPETCPGAQMAMASMSSSLQSQMDSLESIDVTFEIVADVEGQEITAGTPIHWQVIVTVTGDNAGLASYDLNLELRQGSATGSLVNTTLAQPAFANTFNVGGNAGSYAALGGAPLNAGFLVGGPRLSTTSVGAQQTGVLIGFGAGYTPPWVYTPKSNRLTPGLGLAGSKSSLLYDPQGEYVLHTGTLDTTGLSAGHYVLRLVPGERVNVLRPELNYTTNLDTNFAIPAGSVSEPDTAEFDVVEQ